MALDLNPQSPAQAATQDIEQQSANAPSVAIAPGQPEVPMAGAPSPAATPPVHPFVAGTASTALAALNNAPAKPGNFARSVLTGVLHTMSKLGGGAEKVMAGLSQPGGGIDTLGIMAGSKPGQEYNDVQAAARARHTQGQQDVLFKQQVAQNDIASAKATFELEHARTLAQQHDTDYQNSILDDHAKQVQTMQAEGSVVRAQTPDLKAAMQARKPGDILITIKGEPNADGTYKPLYNVVDPSGTHTLTPEEQQREATFNGKPGITNMPTKQWALDSASMEKNEVTFDTLKKVENDLNLSADQLDNFKNTPKALATFGSYLQQVVGKSGPNAPSSENITDAYMHMIISSGEKDPKTGTFTTKAKDAQEALQVFNESFGLKAIGGLQNSADAEFKRYLASLDKNASSSQKSASDTATKRLKIDQDAWDKANARVIQLEQIVNTKGNPTLMGSLLKKAGLTDINAAQTELDTQRGYLTDYTKKIAADRGEAANSLKHQARPMPNVGDVINGHKYLGGPVNNPNSWQQVAPIPGQSVKVQ